MTIRKSIRVERPPQVAFKVFCEEIGQWWPLKQGFSFGGDRAKEIFIEARVGGRFYERFTEGTEYEVGRVTAYQPPNIVAFTWCSADWEAPTQVEVRFIAESTGTRVELEHSGWDRGPKMQSGRKSYEGGWDLVLGEYQSRASSAA